jgi:hypothetical protein
MVPAAPAHYRRLVDSAYLGLDATGHGEDTILIGETAPRGVKNPKQLGKAMMPAEFARELFCLKGSYRPYTGKAARVRGCPVTGAERARFTSDHAGLFRAQGWAHHPYSLDSGTWRVPTWRHPLRDNVSIGSLDRLTRTLDRSTRAWTRSSPRKAIWMTEYGYQTTPPDPTAGVSPGRQGRLGAWGESLAYRNPRVASFAQFLLFDDKPLAGLPESDPRRWVTWQSGLLTAEGQSKPHFDDFRLPLHVASRGRMARVFGIFRPAVTDTALTAEIQFAPSGGPWRALRTMTVTNPRVQVAPRRSGAAGVAGIRHRGSPGLTVGARGLRAPRRLSVMSPDDPFGGLFGDPDELRRRMEEMAEQMQGAQKVAWADNAIKLAVDMTVAGINRLNLQGNADQQADEIRGAMTRLFPEAVALVREAREGFGT